MPRMMNAGRFSREPLHVFAGEVYDGGMRDVVYAHIRPDDDAGFVAVCDQLHAVTQGSTLDETVANLREAVSLALEDDLEDYGLTSWPSRSLVATLELLADETHTVGGRFRSGATLLYTLRYGPGDDNSDPEFDSRAELCRFSPRRRRT